ncbi:MAG: ribonuclease III [Myxococcales bacterium]|nr:ribonuclease III [Myxococcales bacterium]
MNEERARAMEAVQEAAGHAFEAPSLLRDALTHRSFANERPGLAPKHNERLELLGDAVFGLAAAALLFETFPDASEGELTLRRADLVCEAGLSEIAEELGVGAALRLGKGEDRSGGRLKPRLLASALEAIVGAVLLDADAARALEVASSLLEPRLHRRRPGRGDHKSRLQERIQADGRPTPTYHLLHTEGPDHRRCFHVAVRVGEEELGRGSGSSKSDAEQAAAQAALGPLEEKGIP